MSEERRQFRQVARRYAESEMLARQQELSDAKAEAARLRAALETLAAIEAPADDRDARRAIERMKKLAGDALRQREH